MGLIMGTHPRPLGHGDGSSRGSTSLVRSNGIHDRSDVFLSTHLRPRASVCRVPSGICGEYILFFAWKINSFICLWQIIDFEDGHEWAKLDPSRLGQAMHYVFGHPKVSILIP